MTRLGVYFDVRNPPRWERPWPDVYARTLDLATRAEALGLDTVWLTEHHGFDDGYLPQPLTLAAAIAARTSRIRIGTAVLLAALRPPAQLAEEAAIVDILSDGRLDLGVGAGYRAAEYGLFGADFSRRFEQVEETVRDVVRLWDGGVTPQPVQRPVPLWGGFFGPRGAALAGQFGMGLLAIDRRLLDPYVRGLVAGGRRIEDAHMAGLVHIVLADDPERAWARIAPHVAYQVDSYNAHAGNGAPPADPERLRTSRTGRPAWILVATPTDAAAHVHERIGGLPAHEVFLWATVGGMPDDIVDRHLELAGELRRRLTVDADT